METLNWNEKLINDESFEKLDYFEYSPHIGTNLNTKHGDIRIVIQNQDQFLLPHKSYLYIEAKLVKEDNTDYDGETDIISLTYNGLMYLFVS